MATSLPLKTTVTDLDKVAAYLKNQVGWVELDKIGKAIPKKHVNGMKIEAMRHLGLLERDGQNVKLTKVGRDYAGGTPDKRADVIRAQLRADPLYNATLEWMHFNDKKTVLKTDVANYWHDDHATTIGGAKGDALTDATVFFMRMTDAAGLGKFVAAGTGRDTHLKMDVEELTEFVTGESAPVENSENAEGGDKPPPPPPPAPTVRVGTGLNVNVEIHIAADAKPATIEEIFKNMRKYLLDGPDDADGN
jgi:hypothetical protein